VNIAVKDSLGNIISARFRKISSFGGGGGGVVDTTGTPASGRVAIWMGPTTLGSYDAFKYSGTTVTNGQFYSGTSYPEHGTIKFGFDGIWQAKGLRIGTSTNYLTFDYPRMTYYVDSHTGFDLAPGQADGAGYPSYKLNTSINRTTSGAILFSIQNYDVEKFYVDKDGVIAGYYSKLTPISAPGSPSEGTIYVNSTDHKVYEYSGTNWVSLSKRDNVTTVSASTYTALGTDDFIVGSTASNTVTITLPPVSNYIGKTYTFKRSGANNMIIDGDASELIDGATTRTLSTDGDKLEIKGTSTRWYITATQ
jgi:hypothetical protein